MLAGMVLLPWVLALLTSAHAATPQQAALASVDFGLKRPPIVTRVNIVGPYAMVLTRGGVMEDSPVTAPILVEHFSFGWQSLEIIDFRCRLDVHALGSRIDARLMQGMPMPKDDRPCTGVGRDAGPSADVVAIRKMRRGTGLNPYVAVSGNWALADWYGGGGGQDLYRKRNGIWSRFSHSGGALGVAEMRSYGVPQSAWCVFGIYNAKCPVSRSRSSH